METGFTGGSRAGGGFKLDFAFDGCASLVRFELLATLEVEEVVAHRRETQLDVIRNRRRGRTALGSAAIFFSLANGAQSGELQLQLD